MASIFKLSRDKGKRNRPYYIQYFDHDGRRVTAKGFTDKGLTEQLAAKLENEVMLRRRGMIDPAQERLLAVKQAPIEGHLEAFDRSLANNTPKHRRLTMTRVRRVVEGCGFRTLAEMDGERVVEWLNAARDAENLGARTYNHYLQAADAFGRWLAATKRLPANPLVDWSGLTPRPTSGTGGGPCVRKRSPAWSRRPARAARRSRATTGSCAPGPIW